MVVVTVYLFRDQRRGRFGWYRIEKHIRGAQVHTLEEAVYGDR